MSLFSWLKEHSDTGFFKQSPDFKRRAQQGRNQLSYGINKSSGPVTKSDVNNAKFQRQEQLRRFFNTPTVDKPTTVSFVGRGNQKVYSLEDLLNPKKVELTRANTNIRGNYVYKYTTTGYGGRLSQDTGKKVQMVHHKELSPDKSFELAELGKNNAYRDTYNGNSGITPETREKMNTISQGLHDFMIKFGESQMDVMLDGNAYDNYITQDGYASEERINEINDYYDKYVSKAKRYNPKTNTYDDTLSFKSYAPLPVWVPKTAENQAMWTYYINYITVTNNAYKEAAREAEFYNSLTAEQKEAVDANAIGISFNDSAGTVNSLADALISGFKAGDLRVGFSNYGHYLKSYIINPISQNKWGALTSNVFSELGDDLDFIQRGARAIWAGGSTLGGDGHNFEGQNDFWVLDVNDDYKTNLRDAQKLFFERGGASILAHMGLRDDRRAMSRATEYKDILKDINNIFMFRGYDITAEELAEMIKEQYYEGHSQLDDLKQMGKNLKETYTNVAKGFYEDTGSLSGNIALSLLTDPGIMIGSTAKTAFKLSEHNVAKHIFNDVLKKDVSNRTIKSFLKGLDDKSVMFMGSKQLESKLGALAKDLNLDKTAKADFVSVGKKYFLDAQNVMNGRVLANTPKSLQQYTGMSKKLAYGLSKGSDAVDMFLLKAALPGPFIAAKVFKSASTPIENFAKRINAERDLMKAQTLRKSFLDITEGNITLRDSLKELPRYKGSYAYTNALYGYQKLINSITSDINMKITAFERGSITAEELVQTVRGRIGELVKGTDYGDTVTDLELLFKEYIPDYNNEFYLELNTLKNTIAKADDSLTRSATKLADPHSEARILTSEEVSKAKKLATSKSDVAVPYNHFESASIPKFMPKTTAFVNDGGATSDLPKSIISVVEATSNKNATVDSLINEIDKAYENLHFNPFEEIEKGIFITEDGIAIDNLTVLKELSDLRHYLAGTNSFKGVLGDRITTMGLEQNAVWRDVVSSKDMQAILDDFDAITREWDKEGLVTLADAKGNREVAEEYMQREKALENYQNLRAYYQLSAFVENIDTSEDCKNVLMKTLFSSKYGLQTLMNNPSLFKSRLKAVLTHEFSESRVGMEALFNKMCTYSSTTPDAFIADYVDELLENDGALGKWMVDTLNNVDDSDAVKYAKRQVLATLLAKGDDFAHLNELATDNKMVVPMFTHLGSKGLDAESDAITEIVCIPFKGFEFTDETRFVDIKNYVDDLFNNELRTFSNFDDYYNYMDSITAIKDGKSFVRGQAMPIVHDATNYNMSFINKATKESGVEYLFTKPYNTYPKFQKAYGDFIPSDDVIDTFFNVCRGALNSVNMNNFSGSIFRLSDIVSSMVPYLSRDVMPNLSNVLNRFTEIGALYKEADNLAYVTHHLSSSPAFVNLASGVLASVRVINVDAINKYFILELLDGSGASFKLPIRTLSKMQDASDAIEFARKFNFAAGADRELLKLKKPMERFLFRMREIVSQSAFSVSAGPLDYLKYIKEPDDLKDMFALCEYILKDSSYDLKTIFNKESDVLQLFDVIDGSVGNSQILKQGWTPYRIRIKEALEANSEGLASAKAYQLNSDYVNSSVDELAYISKDLAFNNRDTFELGTMYTELKKVDDFVMDNFVNTSGSEIGILETSIREVADNATEALRYNRIERLLTADGEAYDPELVIKDMFRTPIQFTQYDYDIYDTDIIDAIRKTMQDYQKDGHDYLFIHDDLIKGRLLIGFDRTKVSIRKNDKLFEVLDNKTGKVLKTIDPINPNLTRFSVHTDLIPNLDNCWNDIFRFSGGDALGTLGRVVTFERYKTFLQELDPIFTEHALIPDFKYGATYQIMFDPGFIMDTPFDPLIEANHTLHALSAKPKSTAVLLHTVTNPDAPSNLRHLRDMYTDEELAEYLSNQYECGLAVVLPSTKTDSGYEFKIVNTKNAKNIEWAASMPHAILPTDAVEFFNKYMNYNSDVSKLYMFVSKMMVMLKSSQLFNIGTIVRNVKDATLKSAIDENVPLSNVLYYPKAIKDIYKFNSINKKFGDILNERNFARLVGPDSDFTFEQYELLRGISDRAKYIYKDTLSSFGKSGIVAGKGIDVDGLTRSEFSQAYDNIFGTSKTYLDKDTLLKIRFGDYVPSESEQMLYDSTIREMLMKLKNGNSYNKIFDYDKLVETGFAPMSYSETLIRYSQLLFLMDEGYTHNQANQKIINTQFTQAARGTVLHEMEFVFPYITFSYNNMLFWMKQMEKNPKYFRYFMDTFGTMYEHNAQQMVEEDGEYNYNRDFLFDSAGISIGDITFKIGDSFLDSLQLLYGGPTAMFEKMNGLAKAGLYKSMYALGLASSDFFSELQIDKNAAKYKEQLINFMPYANVIYNKYNHFAHQSFKWENLQGVERLLVKWLPELFANNSNLTGLNGFAEYQEQLASQGLWYDANDGLIKDISEKNDYGANDPLISFEDKEAYQLIHFGKVFDSNLGKFVDVKDLTPGGLNQEFDFDNDPTAWDRLCDEQWKQHRKVFDYNLGKFVPVEELTAGDLNDPNLTFNQKKAFYWEKFHKIWDANQGKFVTEQYFCPGGLNETLNMPQDFGKLAALRSALYGEDYNKSTHKFVKTHEPSVCVVSTLYDTPVSRKQDNLFAALGIPRVQYAGNKIHVEDGFILTEDGKYVLTDDPLYNKRVFDLFTSRATGTYRRYNGYENYSANKTKKGKKPFRTGYSNHLYDNWRWGWNDKEHYYRWNYQYNYHYLRPTTSSNPMRYLYQSKMLYPYGGSYNKFSFYAR